MGRGSIVDLSISRRLVACYLQMAGTLLSPLLFANDFINSVQLHY